MHDGCDEGVDLSGGWFDAGDHVKFGFPMAWSTAMLAWSIIDYKDAYIAAGEYDNALDQIKWPLDWMIRAHPGEIIYTPLLDVNYALYREICSLGPSRKRGR